MLVVYGLFIVLMSISVFERYHVERNMSARTAEALSELEALQDREAVMREKVEYLQDDRGVEEEIRKNFDVARSGETVVILQGEVTPRSEATTEESDAPEYPWYQFWR